MTLVRRGLGIYVDGNFFDSHDRTILSRLMFGVAEENQLVYVEPKLVDVGMRILTELEDKGIARWRHCLVA
ncbi:unnamed protein product [Linum trigynum]|uniref:Uncharacterized protein n=1 Tax=Linum trigynum TaxID=586398 RepID=A0AAV2CF82_9ROSI